MAPDSRERAARWQRLKASATFVGLATLSILLLLAVFALAVWRAFPAEQFSPTPTIPPYVEPNFAYVSALEGQAVMVPDDAESPRSLQEGAVIAAGPEAIVRVSDAGWLRLGFVNGATAYLDEASEIELRQIAEVDDAVQQTIIHLNRGRLLATSGEESLSLLVRTPSGAQAQAAESALIGVIYDETVELFELHCLEGSCRLAGPSMEPRPVEAGTYRWLLVDRQVSAARPLPYELFQSLGDPGIVPTVTPATGSVTP